MSRADDGVYVELVSDDDAGPTTPTPAAAVAPADDAAPQRRRRRITGVAVAAAVVLALAGVATVRERAEVAALERHAEVPGVVASLQDPVDELWRFPVTDQVLWGTDDVVMTTQAGILTGRDAATGEGRWTLPLPAGAGPGVSCPFATTGDDVPNAVVCWLPRPPEAVSPWGLTAVDVDAGHLLGALPTGGAVLGAAAVDGSVVVAEWNERGVAVARQDVVGGTEQWRTDLSDLPADGRGMLVHATDEIVAVQGRTTVVLSPDDGRELGRWSADVGDGDEPDVRVLGRTGEGFGVWTSLFAGRWYGPDLEPGAALPGRPADPVVLDASTPGVVLLDDGERLLAVDVRSGDRLWDRPAPGRVLLRLDGRVVLTDDGRLTAVDVASGEEQWSVELPDTADPNAGPPLTDGVRVAVPGRDAEGRLSLTAYALDDGDLHWESALPTGSQYLTVMSDHVVAVVRPEGSRWEMNAVLG